MRGVVGVRFLIVKIRPMLHWSRDDTEKLQSKAALNHGQLSTAVVNLRAHRLVENEISDAVLSDMAGNSFCGFALLPLLMAVLTFFPPASASAKVLTATWD